MTGQEPLKVRLAYTAFLILARFDWDRLIGVRARLVDVMLGRKHVGLAILPEVYLGDFYKTLSLGDHVAINRGCHLNASGGLSIGDHVAIGHNCSIVTTNHSYDDPRVTIDRQPVVGAPVLLGSNIWLGARACVLAGVSIADGTVVAAGSVVAKSIEERDTIVGGVPARKIKSRLA